MFNPFSNKLPFEAFTVDSSGCPKCACTKVLIAPTANTHAASARCANCDKFFRWLGKRELQSLIFQHTCSQDPPKPAPDTAPSSPEQDAGNARPSTPATEAQP